MFPPAEPKNVKRSNTFTLDDIRNLFNDSRKVALPELCVLMASSLTMDLGWSRSCFGYIRDGAREE